MQKKTFTSILTYILVIITAFIIIWFLPFWLSSAIICGIILLSGLFIIAFSYFRGKNIDNLLIKKGDPERYLKMIDKLIKPENRSNNYFMVRAIGERNSGRLDDALKSLSIVQINALHHADKILLLNNSADLYICKGEFFKAREYLNNAMALCSKDMIENKVFNGLIASIKANHFLLNLEEGKFDGYEDYLKEELNDERNNNAYEKAGNYYQLGNLYYHQNKIEDAKVYLTRAVKIGNKLYDAFLASELLKKIEKQ